MKAMAFLCRMLLSAPAALAQTSVLQNCLTRQQAIQQVCRGAEVTSGEEFDTFHRAVQKLAQVIDQDRQHMTYIALASNNEINAWAVNFDMTNSMICVPVAMVHFMGIQLPRSTIAGRSRRIA